MNTVHMFRLMRMSWACAFFIFAMFLVGASNVYAADPVGQTGSWDLIFSDEFEGTTLDTAKWEPSWFGGSGLSKPINSDEDGCYDPAQVSVNGGNLQLTAVSTSKAGCVKRDGSKANYASGLVNTRKSFTYAYGYMEARMYLPGSSNAIWNWPAFWSDGTGDWPKTGEIDVMESLSSHQPCWHYHYEDSQGTHQGPGGCVDWSNPTGWHVFGAKWEPGKITYYYDGQKVGEITEGVVSAEHFIILNNGINDRYGINVPATVLVDYVRVWKQEAGTTPTPPDPTPEPSAETVEIRVGAASDDAEEGSSGEMDIGSSDLELVYEPYLKTQQVGMRFQNVTIPQGASITNAYIQFTADESHSTNASLILFGEKRANASAFTTTDKNISSRAKTSKSVAWTPSAWVSGATGSAERTPDLTVIVNELISQSDWKSGNAMAFIVTGSGTRVSESYEGSSSDAPLLHVEYSTGSSSTTNPPEETEEPTPVPTEIGVDSRVVTTDRVIVRSFPSTWGFRTRKQNAGSYGTVVAGPETGSGYTWWKVDFDSGYDGWIAAPYLQLVLSSALPVDPTLSVRTQLVDVLGHLNSLRQSLQALLLNAK